MEKLFKLKENGTDVRTEVLAGITTFMTMAYILAINPSMLSAAGMDATAVLIATCLSAFFGTMCMALFANYPFALAPGMGLNAYFAYTVCLGMGYDWRVALSAVAVEGIIFIVLSLTNVREAIFNAIPSMLKKRQRRYRPIHRFHRSAGCSYRRQQRFDSDHLCQLPFQVRNRRYLCTACPDRSFPDRYFICPQCKGIYPDRYYRHMGSWYALSGNRYLSGNTGGRLLFLISIPCHYRFLQVFPDLRTSI